jgi:hypothetical protein
MNDVANDPWIWQEKAERVALPEGAYNLTFEGVEDVPITLKSGEVKDKWRWLWKVKTGEHAGKMTDTLTDKSISPKNQAGALIVGLLGTPPKAGDNVKALIDECKGKTFVGVCHKGKQGGQACIRTVSRPPQ